MSKCHHPPWELHFPVLLLIWMTEESLFIIVWHVLVGSCRLCSPSHVLKRAQSFLHSLYCLIFNVLIQTFGSEALPFSTQLIQKYNQPYTTGWIKLPLFSTLKSACSLSGLLHQLHQLQVSWNEESDLTICFLNPPTYSGPCFKSW